MQKQKLKIERNVDQLYSLVSFIRISRNRLNIIKELEKRPKFPSELVDRLNINFSAISKYLRQLKIKGIIYCKNPTLRKGRLYSLTTKGQNILEIINIDF